MDESTSTPQACKAPVSRSQLVRRHHPRRMPRGMGPETLPVLGFWRVTFREQTQGNFSRVPKNGGATAFRAGPPLGITRSAFSTGEVVRFERHCCRLDELVAVLESKHQ